MNWITNMDAFGLEYPYPNKVIAIRKELDLNQSLVIKFNKLMVSKWDIQDLNQGMNQPQPNKEFYKQVSEVKFQSSLNWK